jgi:hypothetical protein
MVTGILKRKIYYPAIYFKAGNVEPKSFVDHANRSLTNP